MEYFDIPTDNKNNGLYKILNGDYFMWLFIEIIRMFCKVAAFVLLNDLTWVVK